MPARLSAEKHPGLDDLAAATAAPCGRAGGSALDVFTNAAQLRRMSVLAGTGLGLQWS